MVLEVADSEAIMLLLRAHAWLPLVKVAKALRLAVRLWHHPPR